MPDTSLLPAMIRPFGPVRHWSGALPAKDPSLRSG